MITPKTEFESDCGELIFTNSPETAKFKPITFTIPSLTETTKP